MTVFGITGGMLARNGVNGASDWIKVMGVLLGSVGTGWGRWAEGHVEEEVMQVDQDEDDEEKPEVKPRRQVRPPVPSTIGPKLLLLASTSHISTLSSFLTSPSSKAPTTLLVDFAGFILALLNAFRGSPKWELILDGLMEGKNGKVLARRMLREGVRGRWRNTSDPSGWATFSESGFHANKLI
jgi:ubiquitin-protein ligase E3 C